ncbi:hypothetical protein [Halarsenatibacter silvermanii]|uniref:Uncharacterized protein n=1 Tax=Halarsenatibacter silvermanii TaxID=321763 RepID=A0A1G9RXV2_9FIRM|nr:hypothetical protein [Halarsenatibacter silvermanii]SDM27847.1 hypothetical protein SAMN04488692_12440 [Halarsenatibacter silvermanii]
MDELKGKFYDLTDQEKLEFAETIMPEICELIKSNPEQMQKMMSACMNMMSEGEMDMSQMMQMMGNMNMMGDNN